MHLSIKKSFYLLSVLLLTLVYAKVEAQNLSGKKVKQRWQMPAHITEQDYQSQTVVLKVQPAYRSVCSANRIAHQPFVDATAALGNVTVQKAFAHALPPRQVENKYGRQLVDLSLIYKLKYTADVSVPEAVNRLLHTGMLVYAEPAYRHKLTYIPNDTAVALGLQWHLGRMKTFDAWDIEKGDTNVIVAIVDSGTDLDHPDQVDNFYRNHNDPVNGIDDDNDGYIDNFLGWDLMGADYNNPVSDNDPGITASNNDHGVHVGGISSATTDNSIGGAGVGFNCRMMPVKCAADNDTRGGGRGYIEAGYEGITYAADAGADIINCSWVTAASGSYGQDIVNYATFNKGALIVAGTGNNGQQVAYYPAAYDNVMAVGSTRSSDAKSTFTTYGYHVDIMAPGQDIYSNNWNNVYSISSGTSMASPMVAGAAALVKSKYPNDSPQQIAARLQSTADPIDTVPYNQLSVFKDKLGSGRVNIYEALINTIKPGLAILQMNITDQNNNFFQAGDTLLLDGTYINYINQATGLSVKLEALSSFVEVLHDSTYIGTLDSMQTSNPATPFRLRILPSAPNDLTVLLRFEFKADGNYTHVEYRDVRVEQTYMVSEVNDISMAVSNAGRLGYADALGTLGPGFVFMGQNLIYDIGLIISAAPDKISNNTTTSIFAPYDEDFEAEEPIMPLSFNSNATFGSRATFSDSSAGASSVGLRIINKAYAWNTPADRKYILVRYELINTNTTTLDSVYAGLYIDWDITNFNRNRSDWDNTHKLGYSYYQTDMYAGVSVPGNLAATYYAIDNDDVNNIGVFNGFTDAEKRDAVSSDMLKTTAGVGGLGNDVSAVTGTGPYTIAPGDTVHIAFVLLADTSLAGLQQSADNADIKYNQIITSLAPTAQKVAADLPRWNLFPNPAESYVVLRTNKTHSTSAVATLTDLSGQILSRRSFSATEHVMNLDGLSAGLYIVTVQDEGGRQAFRLIVR